MTDKERERLLGLYIIEEGFYSKGISLVCGIDEAGRGPLAGPVAAAAVILPEHCLIEHLNDSKKITEKRRPIVEAEIKEKSLAWSVVTVEAQKIDEINILEATKKAMLEAVKTLKIYPQQLLIDGRDVLPQETIPQQAIIGGDRQSASIAAASVLAKCHRDRIMVEYDKEYPEYGFAAHKGYGTVAHREAIKKYGLCPIHRRSYKVK